MTDEPHEPLSERRRKQSEMTERDRYADEVSNLTDQLHALRNLLMLYPSHKEVGARDQKRDQKLNARLDAIERGAQDLTEHVHAQLSTLSKNTRTQLRARSAAMWTTVGLLAAMGLLSLFVVTTVSSAQREADAKFERAVITACEQRQRLEVALQGILMQSVAAVRADESAVEYEARQTAAQQAANAIASPPCETLLGG